MNPIAARTFLPAGSFDGKSSRLGALLDELGRERFERPRPGDRLGPYRLLREIGAGNMGTVFLARVRRPVAGLRRGTRVALKVGAGVEREAAIGLRVDHRHVVRVLDRGPGYVVMEHVAGVTLERLLARCGPLPEALCLRLGAEIAAGLAAIHAAGAVHRDLKPENVLVARDGSARILDLGVARSKGDRTTAAFSGTVLYAAPEQLTGEPVDGRADLYALGLLLYELATGAPPVPADVLQGLLDRRLGGHPAPSPAARNPSLSGFFDGVVRSLLAREPGRRPATAAALLETLPRRRSLRGV